MAKAQQHVMPHTKDDFVYRPSTRSLMAINLVHKKKTSPEDIDDTHHATNVSASKSGHMSIVIDESSEATAEMK